MSSLYTMSIAHIQRVLNIYSPCPYIVSQCVQLMFHLYLIFTARGQRVLHLHSRNAARTPSLQHIYCPFRVSTSYLLPNCCQYTIYSTHVQLVHHLSCPCAVSTPSLLPMSSQYTIVSTHNLSEYHLSCSLAVRFSHLLSMLSQYINSPVALILSEYHLSDCITSKYYLSYPCPIRIPHILPMFTQYSTSSAHIQSVNHLSFPCPIRTSHLLPKSHFHLPMSTQKYNTSLTNVQSECLL